MKTILVPTDFSENAYVAAEYACSLAGITKQEVHLLHVYIALYSGYKEDGNSIKQMKWAEEGAVTAMKSLVDNLRTQFPEVAVTGECVQGFMIEVVVDRLKRSEDALVVIGTKGATNLAENMFGSTTYEVIKKSPIPVLVVPIDTPDFSFDHLGFFTAYDDQELDALLSFRQAFPILPRLSMIHFFKKDEDSPDKALDRWRQKLDEAYPDWEISCWSMPVDAVDINAVTQAAEAAQLDLLVFVRPHKSFFQKIFVPSLTKAVANYPTIPSLFIKT